MVLSSYCVDLGVGATDLGDERLPSPGTESDVSICKNAQAVLRVNGLVIRDLNPFAVEGA